MEQMPQMVLEAELKASAAAEAHQSALHEFNGIECPSSEGCERLLAACQRAEQAQKYFLALIQHVKFGGPYPVEPKE